MPYQVIILKPGYAAWVGAGEIRAEGTITLVKGPKNIVVDTGGPWDKDFLTAALAEHGLKPEDVDYVVCTHGHSDHAGNNNLFPDATIIVGYDICLRDVYKLHDFSSGFPYTIDEAVEVIPTPGHTCQDVSVVVHAREGVVAIVGDLFENESDEASWRDYSQFPIEQESNRKKILDLADFIVPGHGEVFTVQRQKHHL